MTLHSPQGLFEIRPATIPEAASVRLPVQTKVVTHSPATRASHHETNSKNSVPMTLTACLIERCYFYVSTFVQWLVSFIIRIIVKQHNERGL